MVKAEDGTMKIKLKILVLLFLAVDVAHANTLKKAPSAKTWLDSLNLKTEESKKFPSKLLILNSFAKGVPIPLVYNHSQCEDVSFISCVEGQNFAYALKINKMPSELKLGDLMKFSGANLILVNEGKGINLYLAGETEKMEFSKSGKLNEKLNPRKILNRLMAVLGYDGVVLAVDGPFLLVGGSEAAAKDNSKQGILIDKSADRWSLDSESQSSDSAKSKAYALLTFENSYEGYAVFRAFFTDSSGEAKIGQKVIIEK